MTASVQLHKIGFPRFFLDYESDRSDKLSADGQKVLCRFDAAVTRKPESAKDRPHRELPAALGLHECQYATNGAIDRKNAVMERIGKKRWAIAEGYIPPSSTGPHPQMTSHETICLLNACNEDAHVEVMLFYADREPVGPYRLIVPAERTKHVRFNDLSDPEPVPKDTDFSSVIESDVPIVVQHTRLDSRQAENALLSTIAFAGNE